MFKKTIEVTECVYLKKAVEVLIPHQSIPTDYLEVPALMAALDKLPDYEMAGWELAGLGGYTFKEIQNPKSKSNKELKL